ncbi:hypothetical protein C5S42_09185 [Candidatus Methanomarinus sp.]|nr:hypothetical protein C5S42_09185 [ANME-2 cluster archaeon]
MIDWTFIIEEDTEAPTVTDASASPDTILNDNGRPRAPGTNTTTLSVTVTDAHSDVANVTIDLSSIGGYANEPMVREGETDTWTVNVNAVAGINLVNPIRPPSYLREYSHHPEYSRQNKQSRHHVGY